MKGGREGETGDGAEKEAVEDEEVGAGRGVISCCKVSMEPVRAGDEEEGAEEMGIDVDTLVMETEYALQGPCVRSGDWAVSGKYELVVLLPGGDFMP